MCKKSVRFRKSIIFFSLFSYKEIIHKQEERDIWHTEDKAMKMARFVRLETRSSRKLGNK